MDTLAVGDADVAVHFLVLLVQVFLQLVQAVEQLLALLERTVVAGFVFDFLGDVFVRVVIV